MSLVVARRTGNAITIVSDTHIVEVATGLPVPALRGVIKSVVFAPYLTISFAGDVPQAGIASKWIYEEGLSLAPDGLVNKLLELHRQHMATERCVDFIVAFAPPSKRSRLWCIKEGSLRESAVAWIGDFEGFEVFQKAFHNPDTASLIAERSAASEIAEESNHPDREEGLISRMKAAMWEVIDDRSVTSVWGFVVPVATMRNGFRYMEYFYSQTAPMDLDALRNLEEMPVEKAEQGQYSVYFILGHDGYSAYPLMYFVEGKFGFAFLPLKEDGLLRAKKYSAPSFEQFVGQVVSSGISVSTRLQNPEILAETSRGSFGKSASKPRRKRLTALEAQTSNRLAGAEELLARYTVRILSMPKGDELRNAKVYSGCAFTRATHKDGRPYFLIATTKRTFLPPASQAEYVVIRRGRKLIRQPSFFAASDKKHGFHRLASHDAGIFSMQASEVFPANYPSATVLKPLKVVPQGARVFGAAYEGDGAEVRLRTCVGHVAVVPRYDSLQRYLIQWENPTPSLPGAALAFVDEETGHAKLFALACQSPTQSQEYCEAIPFGYLLDWIR